MKYVICGIVAITAFIGVALLHGSIHGILLGCRFRRVIKHPDEAYDWFRHHDEWLMFDTIDMQYISERLPKSKLIGPIRFVVPTLGHKEITAYGFFPQAEDSWLKFGNNLQKEKLT